MSEHKPTANLYTRLQPLLACIKQLPVLDPRPHEQLLYGPEGLPSPDDQQATVAKQSQPKQTPKRS